MQNKNLIYKEFINTLTSYYSIMLNISKNKYTPLFQQIDNKSIDSPKKKKKTNKNIHDQELLKSKNPKRKQITHTQKLL